MRSTLILAVLFAMTACSSGPPAKSKAFRVVPEAPEPAVKVTWSHRIDDFEFFTRIPTQFATPKYVAASDELIVATANGEIIKYQASNGKRLWTKWIDASVSAQPGAGGGFTFIADLAGGLRALELVDGSEAWQFQGESSFETAPAFAEGRLLIADASDTLYAIDGKTGEELWRYRRPTPEFFTIQGSGVPLVKDGEVFCGFADGTLVSLQLETGELLWETDLGADARQFQDVDGQLFVLDDHIIASSYAGGVYAIDRFSGEIVWRNRVQAVAKMARMEDFLYVTSSVGRVIAIDLLNGKSIWGFKFKDSLPDGVKPYGPYLLVTTEKPIYVLDRATGYPLRIFRGTAGFSSGLELGGDRLYMFSDYGRLMGAKLGW